MEPKSRDNYWVSEIICRSYSNSYKCFELAHRVFQWVSVPHFLQFSLSLPLCCSKGLGDVFRTISPFGVSYDSYKVFDFIVEGSPDEILEG